MLNPKQVPPPDPAQAPPTYDLPSLPTNRKWMPYTLLATLQETPDLKQHTSRVLRAKTFYNVLGISQDATDSDIKKAYRKVGAVNKEIMRHTSIHTRS